ncbi:MAG: D-aminoacyl-tRNA deacylase [Promethearchaeota archaeon]
MKKDKAGSMYKLKFWIITSMEDPASVTMRNYFINRYKFNEIHVSEFKSVLDNCDENIALNESLNAKGEILKWKGYPILRADLNSIFSPDVTDVHDKLDLVERLSKNIEIAIVTTDKPMIHLDWPDSISASRKMVEESLNNTLNKSGNADEKLPIKYVDPTQNGIYEPDFVIFASRHKSESKIPAILTHTPGNWSDDNTYGGAPNSLSFTSSIMLALAYKNLKIQKRLKNLDWPVDLEVDHHGPTQLGVPIIFMELGSSEENWGNKIGGAAVGDAIMGTIIDFANYILDNFEFEKVKHKIANRTELYNYIRDKTKSMEIEGNTITEKVIFAIGFGGTHYAKNFSRIYDKYEDTLNQKKEQAESQQQNAPDVPVPPFIFISHICPKYSALKLRKLHISNMINRTLESVNTILIDWRGLNSEEKKYLLQILEQNEEFKGLSIKKTKEIKF